MHSTIRFIAFLSATALIIVMPPARAQSQEKGTSVNGVEERTYVLAGYVPVFYEYPGDPFDGDYAEKQNKYHQRIKKYLSQHGITPMTAEFIPATNSLILTDTPANLEHHETRIRNLFRPDMQLAVIASATEALGDEHVFDGDQLYRTILLEELTLRAFHDEVRKLESVLEFMPLSDEEARNVKKRLSSARKYRAMATKLYLDSLHKQRALIERWKKDNSTTEQDVGDKRHGD